MSVEPCTRCGGTRKLRSGADCPGCTHIISYKGPFRGGPGSHIHMCSCGWRHTETSRQNALGRAAKERAAVAQHLREVADVR